MAIIIVIKEISRPGMWCHASSPHITTLTNKNTSILKHYLSTKLYQVFVEKRKVHLKINKPKSNKEHRRRRRETQRENPLNWIDLEFSLYDKPIFFYIQQTNKPPPARPTSRHWSCRWWSPNSDCCCCCFLPLTCAPGCRWACRRWQAPDSAAADS